MVGGGVQYSLEGGGKEKQHLFMVGGGVLFRVVSGRLFEWWRGNFFEWLGEWGLVLIHPWGGGVVLKQLSDWWRGSSSTY